MRYLILFMATIILVFANAAKAGEEPELHPQLEVFRPYLETYWIGDVSQPGSATPSIDRSYWQRALNGQAIKTTHSINDGEYGGESMIFWDEKKQSLVYYYFTTAGFYTHGTMHFDADDNTLEAYEQVENNVNGITAVKSFSIFNQHDGTLNTRSEYLQNGQWQPGHRVSYRLSGPLHIIFQ
jgi:hypothetical protein